jgi:hypothetical protein
MSKENGSTHKMELLSVILVSLIVAATAWCAYQATVWGGIQTLKIADSHNASRDAALLNIEQNQRSMVDASMFFHYVEAVIKEDKKLSDFYFERFRPDFKPAVQAWLDTNPIDNQNAPAHPFEMKEYKRPLAEQASELEDLSKSYLDDAAIANHNVDNYVLFTVIFAAMLILGTMSSKFSSIRLDQICFIIGASLFTVMTVMLVFIMPIAISEI